MEHALRQITNTLDLSIESKDDRSIKLVKNMYQKPMPKCLIKHIIKNDKLPTIKNYISVSTNEIDFGPCLPSTVHQQSFSINLSKDLPKVTTFCLQIICKDQVLNRLPQYVFAIKKGQQMQFTNLYRFKLVEKGRYDFIVAVKTPNINIGQIIQSQLQIKWEIQKQIEEFISKDEEKFIIKLKQKPYYPQIECLKELVMLSEVSSNENHQHQQPFRVLKFYQNFKKPKKEIKVSFDLKTQSKISINWELLGVKNQFYQIEKDVLQLAHKGLVLNNNAGFTIWFKFNFRKQMQGHLITMSKSNPNQKVSYTLRRILVLKVVDTDLHFHFPVEVTFFLGDKITVSSSG